MFGKTTSRDTNGTSPTADYTGGFAYTRENQDDVGGGVEGGFGIQSGLLGSEDGWHVSSELLSGNGYAGLRQDGQVGIGGGGKVAGIKGGYGQEGKGNHFGFDADALGANAGVDFGPGGASAGASAYLLQGSVQGGNIGTGNHDSMGRFGMGLGVGAGGRLHWDDKDGDGLREYGIGADIGPFSFDYKTEDPVRDLIPGVGMVADLLAPDTNITSAAGDMISGAASAVGSFFSGW